MIFIITFSRHFPDNSPTDLGEAPFQTSEFYLEQSRIKEAESLSVLGGRGGRFF